MEIYLSGKSSVTGNLQSCAVRSESIEISERANKTEHIIVHYRPSTAIGSEVAVGFNLLTVREDCVHAVCSSAAKLDLCTILGV